MCWRSAGSLTVLIGQEAALLSPPMLVNELKDERTGPFPDGFEGDWVMHMKVYAVPVKAVKSDLFLHWTAFRGISIPDSVPVLSRISALRSS